MADSGWRAPSSGAIQVAARCVESLDLRNQAVDWTHDSVARLKACISVNSRTISAAIPADSLQLRVTGALMVHLNRPQSAHAEFDQIEALENFLRCGKAEFSQFFENSNE